MKKIDKASDGERVLWFQPFAVRGMLACSLYLGDQEPPGPGWYKVPTERVLEMRDALKALVLMTDDALDREVEAKQAGR